MKVFTLLFTAHILGDYYFQPEALAVRKSRGIGWTLLHCLIYTATLAVSLIMLGGGYIWAAAVCAGTHLVIDVVKQLILNSGAKAGVLTVKGERAAFCVDQILHLGIMLAASLWATVRFGSEVPDYIVGLKQVIGRDPYRLLAYAAMALAVMKPANVFIRRMLVTEKPGEEPKHSAEQTRAGRYIGALERLIVLALLVLGQYGSIAIVFTAKSIARFKQLENRDFAEYYIFGSLLSIATAVGVFILLNYFGAAHLR